MSQAKKCRNCGTDVPSNAPFGHCPQCLIALGFGPVPETFQSPESPSAQPAFAGPDSALGSVHYFGDYEIIEKIAQGGMGTVYKARQVSLNRLVALKLISAGALATPELVKRFKAEAEAAASLSHPNIVPIYEIGEHEGQHYFSMGLVEGLNLREALEQTRNPKSDNRNEICGYEPRRAAQLLSTVARAVHYAHQRGVLHRDIKPSNILLDANSAPYLTDFGLAKLVERESTLTHTDAIMGTPAYMSPEQARGETKDVTTAADVYGLGAVLYEALTGSPPFGGGTSMETIRQVLEQEPRRPSIFNPAIDRDLETICLKCLEKEPARRYGSAEALADDLDRWLNHKPIHAQPSTPTDRVKKWAKRNPAIASLSGVAMVLLLVVAIGSPIAAWRINRERQRAETVAIELRRKAYAAEMNVAFQALAENNLGRAVQLLDRQRPKSGENDLRGFEWRYLWSLCRDRSEATFSNAAGTCVTYSPDGKLLAYCEGDRGIVREVVIREASSHRILTNLPASPVVSVSLSFSPVTNLLAIADESSVKLLDTTTWRNLAITLPGAAHLAKFSPDGRWLLTGSSGGDLVYADQPVQLWNTETWRPVASAPIKSFFVWAMNIAFSPDSRFVVTPPLDERKGFDLRTVPDLKVIPGIGRNAANMGSVAFTADGKYLVEGLVGGALFVWDVESGTLLEKLPSHTATIWATAVSSEGKIFATASSDRVIKLRDAATRQQLVTLRGHSGEIIGLAFSPDGRKLASIAVNGRQEVKLWGYRPTRPS